MTPEERTDWLVADAVKRLHFLYDTHGKVVIFTSGGKDSTAVVECAAICGRERGIRPEVWFFDWEIIPEPGVEYLLRQAGRDDIDFRWFALPLGEWWGAPNAEGSVVPFDPRIPKERWFREPPGFAITRHEAFDAGHTTGQAFQSAALPRGAAEVYGVRSVENAQRRMFVSRRKADRSGLHWLTGNRRAYPVCDWRTKDVWGAIHDRGWDWNRAYIRMHQSGRVSNQMRWGSFFQPEAQESVSAVVREWPELWNRIVETDRVPGAAALARYHRTGLFGTGKDLDIADVGPAGALRMLRELLFMASPASQAQITEALREVISVCVRGGGRPPWRRMVRLAVKYFFVSENRRYAYKGPVRSVAAQVEQRALRAGRAKRGVKAHTKARGWLYMMREQRENRDGKASPGRTPDQRGGLDETERDAPERIQSEPAGSAGTGAAD